MFRAIGLVCVLLGVGFDALFPHSAPGFGAGQMILVAAGIGIGLSGVLQGGVKRTYVRIASVVVLAYLALLVLEVLSVSVFAPTKATQNPLWSLRGFVQPSSWGGYELTPGWRGRYDDGVLSADVEINALGDRDLLPEQHRPDAERRVLLLGDSMAFGWGLSAAETIDGQIERVSADRIASYDLGVPGYGPEDTLEHFRESTQWAATDTFFLMFNNDLRQDNCRKAIHTAFEGLILPRNGPRGSPLGTAELHARVAEAQRGPRATWIQELKQVMVLLSLRERIAAYVDVERLLTSGRPEQFSADCVHAAVQHTRSMQELAIARAQTFGVVVIPTRGESTHERYSRPTAAYVAELRSLAISVIEVRDQLGPADYFAHDEHLSASGAAIVARAIVESLR